MSMQHDPTHSPHPAKGNVGRRIAGAVFMGLLVFVAMWVMAASVVTSVLVGTGTVVVLFGAGTWSGVVEMVIDWFADLLSAILSGLASIYAAFMSLLD